MYRMDMSDPSPLGASASLGDAEVKSFGCASTLTNAVGEREFVKI
jgi:hypothetical protein